jgi:hypothetical protein
MTEETAHSIPLRGGLYHQKHILQSAATQTVYGIIANK